MKRLSVLISLVLVISCGLLLAENRHEGKSSEMPEARFGQDFKVPTVVDEETGEETEVKERVWTDGAPKKVGVHVDAEGQQGNTSGKEVNAPLERGINVKIQEISQIKAVNVKIDEVKVDLGSLRDQRRELSASLKDAGTKEEKQEIKAQLAEVRTEIKGLSQELKELRIEKRDLIRENAGQGEKKGLDKQREREGADRGQGDVKRERKEEKKQESPSIKPIAELNPVKSVIAPPVKIDNTRPEPVRAGWDEERK